MTIHNGKIPMRTVVTLHIHSVLCSVYSRLQPTPQCSAPWYNSTCESLWTLIPYYRVFDLPSLSTYCHKLHWTDGAVFGFDCILIVWHFFPFKQVLFFSVKSFKCKDSPPAWVSSIGYIYILINVWDATQSSLFIVLQVHSTCFGCQPHPSGVHKTVTATSSIGHIFCAATSLPQGQAKLAHVGGR